MSRNFERAINRILDHEGVWSSNPKDAGNWTGGRVGSGILKGTKYGIAANTYPEINIKSLSLAEAKNIYYRDFWSPIQADKFPFTIAYQVLDYAVNSGQSRAVKSLQRAVGEVSDGLIGKMTIGAVSSLKSDQVLSVAVAILSERLSFMTDISGWRNANRGWAKRIALNMEFAVSDSLCEMLFDLTFIFFI